MVSVLSNTFKFGARMKVFVLVLIALTACVSSAPAPLLDKLLDGVGGIGQGIGGLVGGLTGANRNGQGNGYRNGYGNGYGQGYGGWGGRRRGGWGDYDDWGDNFGWGGFGGNPAALKFQGQLGW